MTSASLFPPQPASAVAPKASSAAMAPTSTIFLIFMIPLSFLPVIGT